MPVLDPSADLVDTTTIRFASQTDATQDRDMV